MLADSIEQHSAPVPPTAPAVTRTTLFLRELARHHYAPAHAAWLACALALLAALGDWATGADAAFTLFYVLPLALAVWFVNLRMGLVIAAFCVVAGALCDVFRAGSRPGWYFIVWNNMLEAALYVVFAHLLAAVRDRVANEVRQRAEVLDKLRHSERLSSTGKLAARIAQEISAPLDRIREQVEALGGVAAPELVGSAREIQAHAERIREVVQQLLNFSQRATTGIQRADLNDLVAETIAVLQPIANEVGVEIVLGGVAVEAEFNSAEIQQVVTNLITNAIRAMPGGGVLEVVTDATFATLPGTPRGEPQRYARISVRDHGVGISPDVLPCVFDPFAAKEGIGRGAQLGLSVSYQIVEEHGGWITVDTRLGEGTSFHVHLPC